MKAKIQLIGMSQGTTDADQVTRAMPFAAVFDCELQMHPFDAGVKLNDGVINGITEIVIEMEDGKTFRQI